MSAPNTSVRQPSHNADTVQMLLDTYYTDDMAPGILALSASHASLGMWDVDVINFNTKWSNQLMKIMGLLPGTHVNFDIFYSIIHPDDLETIKEVIKRSLARDEKFECEFRVIRPIDGETIWIRQTGKTLFNAEGKAIRVVGANLDITHLKQAEQKAQNSDRAKSEFLANMSHEIRTPMNGIMGMAQLLENSDIGSREQDFVKTINRSANALLTIINDILDFSKVEAGFMELDAAPFHLRDSIEDVTTLLSSKVSETGVDLLLRVQPDLPSTFVGDVGRFRQILTNLLGNAVKFTMEGHVFIDISGEVDDEQARLTIKIQDTGIGIDKKKLEGIFDKFSQADNSTTRRFGGTGLGLAITKQLVELMDGTITAESTPDEGSTFTVNLNLPTHEDLVKPELKQLNIAGSTILVIDDNAVNRDILKEQLSFWKCRSALAPSAKVGLAALRRAQEKNIKIDLIIVDYQMPDMNGEDFVRQIKADKNLADTPVIVLSSVDESILRTRMMELNISAFMCKPARASILYNAIGTALFEKSLHKLAAPQSSEIKSGIVNKPVETAVMPRETTATPRLSTPNSHIDILVAEDNEVNQMYIKYVLEDLGFSFKIVPNGRIAVDKWKLLSPKLVLMDVSMPEMNGYEATAAIRAIEADRQLPRTPIIAVTAHSLKGDDKKCLEQDMDDYLSKPLAIENLKKTLVKWGVMQAGKRLTA